MQFLLKNKILEIKQLCKVLKINKLYAFGSVMSNNFNEDSDVDFIFSFSEKLTIEQYTNNYFNLHSKLKDILKREIDLITEKSLSNPYLIESINKNKVLIYEA